MNRETKLQITKWFLDRMEETFQFLEKNRLIKYPIVSKPMYALFGFITKIRGNVWRNP